jgi:GT2 family glycosyltransferase
MFPTAKTRTCGEHNAAVAPPDIAVVIPTHRRETRLAFALEALAQQTLPRERFELVVVRGSVSGPRTEAPDGLPVRFLDHRAESGPAEKRNRGWRAASAPLVAFTDDDTRPHPEWLETLLAAARHAGGDGFVLQGPTLPDPDEAHLRYGLARTQEIRGPSKWFEACNIAYPRPLLERLDGFDERFSGAGEDTDLGLRAIEAGARPLWCEQALVWHAVHSRHLPAAMREAAAWETMPLVFRRHPTHRRALHAGVFLWPSHGRLVLAAAGALSARRRPALALAAAPYLRRHMRGYRRTPRGMARAALDLPPRLLVDAVGTAATARHAWRHRVALL